MRLDRGGIGMTKQQMIDWIDNASYGELLEKWRFAPVGSPWFQGKVGQHYSLTMNKRRAEISNNEQVSASKNVGWEMKLTEIEERIQILQDTLESMDGLSPEEEIEKVQDMLDQMEGAREDKLLNIARWRKQLRDEADGVIKPEIQRLQARKKSYENRAEGISNYLHFNLDQIGGKLKAPLGSLGIQNNSQPSVTILDADLVPSEYFVEVAKVGDCKSLELSEGLYRVEYYKEEIYFFTFDKRAIGKHFKETGEQVPGTETKIGTHVRLR